MGYMRHHAIIVTGQNRAASTAHVEAARIFGDSVTPLTEEAINGYHSFLVGPDGSKEGWAESDEGDKRRSEFKAFLRLLYVSWAEVQYGDDEHDNRVVAASGGVGGATTTPVGET